MYVDWGHGEMRLCDAMRCGLVWYGVEDATMIR
jgi:hypothetical protein